MRALQALSCFTWLMRVALSVGVPSQPVLDEARDLSDRPLQTIVTYDTDSVFAHGERVFLLAGDYQPFRLPVPSLWIDNFQKIKAMGFNAVSFYVYWPLLEGKPGKFSADGVFALEQWFKAATDAGIYLIARPGPYIHSESSGGGLPGWMQRVQGTLRTSKGGFLDAIENYLSSVSRIIAKAQITNGGPVILVQAENEYSEFGGNETGPDGGYMKHIINILRREGIVVPITNNDHSNSAVSAPGSGIGAVDIYGYDNYPIGVGCWNLYDWPAGNLQEDYWVKHLRNSPNTPHAIMEFQAGSGGSWKEKNYDICSESVNEVFERVVYKNNYASAVKIMNLYLTAGGTNWGNIGYPLFYTSYDVGAMIREDRTLNREKYAEMKLQGQFFKVTPAYLDSRPVKSDTESFTNDTSLRVTQLSREGSNTSLYVIRHAAYESRAVTPYKLKISTSRGSLNVPYFEYALTLNGRDSKIHVSDYDVGGKTLLYSSAEVLTWKKYEHKTVLVLYGGPNESHEAAIVTDADIARIEGKEIRTHVSGGVVRFGWDVSTQERTVLKIDNLYVYLLDRNSAYKYFVPILPSKSRGSYGSSESNPDAVIVKAGYLVRQAAIDGPILDISADFNATTEVEVIGCPAGVTQLRINGKSVHTSHGKGESLSAIVEYQAPSISLPELINASWKYADGLPEIRSEYDDTKWRIADNTMTNNDFIEQLTPTALYGSEYGFHSGYLVFRGHFTASGGEQELNLTTSGGYAFGDSVWLNDTYLGSWEGETDTFKKTSIYKLPFALKQGANYVLTVIVDNNGRDMNFEVGVNTMKAPRGILDFKLGDTRIEWKITGNLGGEDYADHVRGPTNEGGSYPERQGWHQPQPPSSDWKSLTPVDGQPDPGIGFFTTEFDLDIPVGWDVPIDVLFTKTETTRKFRVQLFVNGWQFGKFNGLMGPQLAFPVPEGILNYRGRNTISLTLWNQEKSGSVGVEGISLKANVPVLTGRPPVEVVDSPAWSAREKAY
ncbi:glycosyl hydrolase family 35 [Colletotrichum truncatum]|uniref:Glycosyl hydrolase family 35 n=1 Tax=Colletotrichum truncatum TaxID=5467 RepID=A0ACC3ZKR2_COLTU|nr:glycosyl hydrolase family 35 [Colletotrichum truncatum]KAF6799872.1 glycosyl hydrolase family 35 [Colletotrichum truncatum]